MVHLYSVLFLSVYLSVSLSVCLCLSLSLTHTHSHTHKPAQSSTDFWAWKGLNLRTSRSFDVMLFEDVSATRAATVANSRRKLAANEADGAMAGGWVETSAAVSNTDHTQQDGGGVGHQGAKSPQEIFVR